MEAKYGGVRSMGEWFPGKVVAVSTDGGLTYSIDYADGDKETGVLPKYVRPLVTGAAAAAPKAAEAKQARAEAKPSGEDGQRCGGQSSGGFSSAASRAHLEAAAQAKAEEARVAAAAAAAAETEPDSEEGVETEFPPDADNEEETSEAEPAGSYHFASPLDTRKRERDADDAAGAAGAAGAKRPRRRAATEGRAWMARDKDVFELIKEHERSEWHTAAALQGGVSRASRAAFEEALDGSDLSDNCVCDPDSEDYDPC